MDLFNAADDGALLKAILQESASQVLVLDADTLRIIHANPAAVKNLQYSLKALQKLTPPDFLSPEDGRAFKTLITLLKNGKKRRTVLDMHCCRSDGTCYPVESRLFISSDRGKPVFICLSNDVSQREATRQALAHSESDLRAIAANIPGMAYQILRKPDGSTSMPYVSEKSLQLLGIKSSILRANPDRFLKLIQEEDKADYLAKLAEADGVHLGFNWEGRIWIKAWKDVKWVNIRVSQRQEPAGLIWDGIMLNVTHSKLAEAEIRRSRAQLSALASHVETVKEQERQIIARELHDDLGGNLTAIKIGLSWLKKRLPPGETSLVKHTDYLDNVVDQTIDATQRIASNLRPSLLDFGIVHAIKWTLQDLRQQSDITYELSAPSADIPLSSATAITVFRIVQEALTNVARHAHCTQVKVTLARKQGDLLVTITDNGQGVQTTVRGKKDKPGFGVLGMVERAAALGGELNVQPAKRQGTQVTLRIPLISPESDGAK
ncbi:MAG: PAS domain-containing sensor histidine kinase [Thiobacillus sp.]